jgi:hypothetical protein
MAIVLLSQGAEALLDGSWSTATPSTCRLIANDSYSGLSAAQLQALDETDFSEPSFVGYSSMPLVSWTIAGPSPSSATHSELTFTATAAPTTIQTIHGWWLERDSDALAIAFEVFSNGPFIFSRSGDSLTFSPIIAFD